MQPRGKHSLRGTTKARWEREREGPCGCRGGSKGQEIGHEGRSPQASEPKASDAMGRTLDAF